MATYAAMRQSLIDLLNRSDFTDPNAALVKGWFDNSIQRIQREVRAPHMERVLVVDTTLSVSQVSIPNDWLETKAFVWDNGTDSGEVSPLELGTYYHRKNEVFDFPTFYCRQGSVWLVNGDIPAGATANVVYYGEETALVNDNDETTLCKIASDLIIYGALTYASDYFIDDRKDTWETKWSFFREQIQSQSSEGENQNGANAVQPFAEYDDGV
jgi:hypothetical protein